MIPQAGYQWKQISPYGAHGKWHIQSTCGPQFNAHYEQSKTVKRKV